LVWPEISYTSPGLSPEVNIEELITEGEGIVRTDFGKIFVLKGNICDLNWLYPVE
jgi:hypothetical protein